LASTDDRDQLLLEVALRSRNARVVYLARATALLPFGPDSYFPSEEKTKRVREVDTVVGVSEYVASYIRQHAGIAAVHVPISLMEPGASAMLGRFENEWVTIVNPCAVKGISIFLALADAFPQTMFAAVPNWGTNAQDRAALDQRANVRVLDLVDDIDILLARTRVLLVPSLWAEARSRMVLEAMLRGVPVMASNVGGIPEAKMGVPYLLPVNPIAKYAVDEQMAPVDEVPPQDLGPWREALARLMGDRAHYEQIARASRAAALEYAANLNVGSLEEILERVVSRPKIGWASGLPIKTSSANLSPDKRRLLALRLRKKAPASAWFPGANEAAGLRVFWFPHAGGGAAQPVRLPHYATCPVRLPGRESRLAEAPFERMEPLVEALASAIELYTAKPFAFFGHSMGAAVAFELARLLRRRQQPLPVMLIASGARAPQYRRNHVPPAAPGDEEFLAELRGLQGMPDEVLEDPAMMRALLPALRADAALYRNYVYREDTPLDCPI
ncbi:MAG TPA: thioesterase domain-containing protein, partial [Candidatus Solibacter sp.]|nr:thioesterase domain-containing protein [Candidatus Solibacter sp.]